jgi:hypothetical protein
MEVHICNLSSLEAEAGGREFQAIMISVSK